MADLLTTDVGMEREPMANERAVADQLRTKRPEAAPDIGEIVFATSPGSFSNRAFAHPLRVTRLTGRQVIAVDPDGREHRFWRETYREVAGRTGRAKTLHLVRPEAFPIVPRWKDHEWLTTNPTLHP